MRNFLLISWVLGTVLPSQAWAGEPEAAQLQALEQTQQLLKTPALRAEAVAATPGATLVGAQVRTLAGGAKTEDAIYGASAGIFDGLFHQTDGDPLRMKEILQKAKGDPKGFYDSLSPEDRKAIETISRQIVEDRNGVVTAGGAPGPK